MFSSVGCGLPSLPESGPNFRHLCYHLCWTDGVYLDGRVQPIRQSSRGSTAWLVCAFLLHTVGPSHCGSLHATSGLSAGRSGFDPVFLTATGALITEITDRLTAMEAWSWEAIETVMQIATTTDVMQAAEAMQQVEGQEDFAARRPGPRHRTLPMQINRL
jgi:hypothetical protein